MRKFVVVGVQRSGTTLVTTSLDSHPAIQCAGELFKMHRSRGDVDVRDSGYRAYLDTALRLKLADRVSRRRLVGAFLDRFFDQPGFDAIGFKLMNNQTHPGQFPMAVPLLIDRHVSVLHIIRENVLKTHLSRLMAQHRRVFHATRELPELPKLKVPTGDLVRKLARIEAQGAQLSEMFEGMVPYLVCTYERYVADPVSEGRRILAFLGVPNIALQSRLVKVSSDNISQIVENLDEVASCLQGTLYEKWFESGDGGSAD